MVPALSSVLLLLSAFNSEALTARTTNVINGHAPYLTFDGGATKATDVNDLLWIALPDGTKITPNTNPSSYGNPIELQVPNISFSDINMLVPVDSNAVSLNTLIGPPNNYWKDDDGDDNATATGQLTLSIRDNEGHIVTRSETLNICKSPYTLTLHSSGGTLRTRYGIPSSSTFNSGSAIYYFKLKPVPTVCFARPNLNFGTYSHDAKYRGPSNIWSPNYGFLVQSTDPAHYDKNFPTTGANNLFFDLMITGVDARSLSWPDIITHPSGITVEIRATSTSMVRVKLVGPHANRTQIDSNTPSRVARPNLSSPFKIVGQNSSGDEVITYGFKLNSWFVNRGHRAYQFVSEQRNWCHSIGYITAYVSDLTNAVPPSGWVRVSSGMPHSSGNHYMRHIGAGLLAEWGNMGGYVDAGFYGSNYWVRNGWAGVRWLVNFGDGELGSTHVENNDPSIRHYTICRG
jgi:hypothetical protein